MIKSNLRIAILFDSYSLGGAEFHAFKLAKYFIKELKQEVEIWVNSFGDGTIKKMCDQEQIPNKLIGSFSGIARTLYFRQILHFKKVYKPFNPDVVISFNLLPNLLNSLVSKHAGVKCVVWSQQNVINYSFIKKSEKKALKNVDCFISNAYHASALLQKVTGQPESKFFVVPNGIEKPVPLLSRQEWYDKLGISDADFKVIMVANITETKDHITLLKAWKIVVTTLTRVNNISPVLILAGRIGATINDLQVYLLDNNLIKYVKFTGPVGDISGLYMSMDLAVLSSKAEGLSNSVMEAMSCSLPVAGTDIAGIREAVGAENYQFLAPPDDDKILAEKIIGFAINKELRKTTGENNKKRIEEKFSVVKMVKDTFRIIENNIEKN
jgi:glycosyltransferase involved in cell wall biosynthesis